MKVDTRWFGTIDIDDEKIITFDLGVIGFEDCKKFTLIYDVDKGDEASIMWLQSLDEPELALPMLKPELIKEDYDPIVEDEMLKALGSDIKEAAVWIIRIDLVAWLYWILIVWSDGHRPHHRGAGRRSPFFQLCHGNPSRRSRTHHVGDRQRLR